MRNAKSFPVLLLVFSLLILTYMTPSRAEAPIAGINFPGPGIAGHVFPGQEGKTYHFPSAKDVESYANFGFKIIRLAFTWERLQPELNKPFNSDYLAGIDAFIEEADKHGLQVLLDVHNYARYKGEYIGSEEVSVEAFADFWHRLAQHYIGQQHVMFGLMNEPFKQDAQTWAKIAQQGINAIRETGAQQKILVPATYYSSAARWLHKHGQYSNGETLQKIDDPQNNIIFEAHQYLDQYSTGLNDKCVSSEVGVERLTAFTGWLKENGYQGFLGEFAVGESDTCQKALSNMLQYMHANSDVWYGWSYWVADPWFKGYRFNVYPADASQSPQLKILKSFIN
ncbi:MAG: glycoside hydrolase family 5 protein [Methylophaga sp.]